MVELDQFKYTLGTYKQPLESIFSVIGNAWIRPRKKTIPLPLISEEAVHENP